jgi:branched-chain amino acid transport system substrate-binding protein
MVRLSVLLLVPCIALLVSGCGGSGGGESADEGKKGPIVIGTANSLTGILAPFELAINDGMDVAAADINAAGGVDGRRIEIIHADAKSDLNLAATATLEVIEKGAQIVVPICDADYGAPGARAANEKGILAITCAGAPGIGKQTIGPLTFNTAADAEYAYRTMGWRRAYFLCDRILEYTKVVCEAFKTRWKELGGEVAGEDTFLQSDTSIAAQVTRLKNASKPDFVVLASYPGGSPAIKEIRAAYAGPIVLSAAYSGTFWLKPTPHLSNVWVAAVGSSYGDDPRAPVNEFFRHYEEMSGKAAVVDSYPLLGYSLVQTIARGVEISGTTDGEALAKALETFKDEPLLAGPTTYTESCHVPVQRPLLIIRYEDGKPHSTGDFVRAEKVPRYPC